MSNQPLQNFDPLDTGATARRLVILIPGMGPRKEAWMSLVRRLQQEAGYAPGDAHWMWVDHKIQPWTPGDIDPQRMRDPSQPGPLETLAQQLRNQIHNEWLRHDGYDDVVLVGHSIGGLLARRIYLLAAGAVPRHPPSPWGAHVSRIILFAAVNRGFPLGSLGRAHYMVAELARGLSKRVFYFEDALQGSDFVSNLRIDWIRYFRKIEDQTPERMTASPVEQSGVPLVMQFLGDSDELVTDADHKDLLAFPNGHFREVAGANHANLYRLDIAQPESRYRILQEAFVDRPTEITTDASQRPAESPVHTVVMIMHGIRTNKIVGWIAGLESKLKRYAPPGTRVYIPTYGYLTALRFALPWIRSRHIPIFRDEYTELLAEHPRAQFSIIAHSNGTYMLGHCLKKTPGMRFENLVLAGCALPQDYDWEKVMDPHDGVDQQVKRVLNELATGDFPVAILCNGLRGIGMKDIGPAGFTGFLERGPSIRDAGYHKGDHGVALRPTNQERLVQFVLGGNPQDPEKWEPEPFLFSWLSRASPYLIWAVLAGLFVSFGRLIFPKRTFNSKRALGSLIGILVTLGILDSV